MTNSKINSALDFFKKEDYKKALDLFNEALIDDENNQNIINNIALCEMKLGKQKEAEEHFLKGEVMKLVSYLSESGLGLDIFVYAFIFAGIILVCGVIYRKRTLSLISYYIAIFVLIYFILFSNLDAYSNVQLLGKDAAQEIRGIVFITLIINVICTLTIYGITRAIKRLKSDVRYSF